MAEGVAVACYFFFSSRRRHTRLDCDWSSDGCSSDLTPIPTPSPTLSGEFCPIRCIVGPCVIDVVACKVFSVFPVVTIEPSNVSLLVLPVVPVVARSEERRVGKECRSGWSQDQCKK